MAKCWSCHPAYITVAEIKQINEADGQADLEVRPNLYEAELKDSDWGAPIQPPDFLVDRVKNGIEVSQLVQIVAAGVGGTAMPMWAGALSDEQLWGLAHYLRWVALWRGSPEGRALKQRLSSQAPTNIAPDKKTDL
jgi:hypothetical protein